MMRAAWDTLVVGWSVRTSALSMHEVPNFVVVEKNTFVGRLRVCFIRIRVLPQEQLKAAIEMHVDTLVVHIPTVLKER